MYELNENKLAEKLRKQCHENGKEKDPKESAETLHKLGKVYRKKSPDKQSLMQSVGLMTSSLIRRPLNLKEIAQDLEEVCTHILELAGVHGRYEDISKVVTDIKQQIEIFRESCRTKMNVITKISDNADQSVLIKLQLKKMTEISDVQNFINKTYINLMQGICELCLSLLGEAPCKFAVAGMGSLAREEITPYSDFESIILLEDEIKEKSHFESVLDYFRWFSMIFQMILVLHGETVLRFLAIPCLNNTHDKTKNWFYDEYTPCGICPDGFAPAASKNPLGRQTPTSKKPWTTELIKTVSDVVKYLESDEDLKNGYHLSDILMHTCFIFGERNVFIDFSLLVNTRRCPIMLASCSQRFLYEKQLENDFDVHSFFSFQIKRRGLTEMDLKRVFCRGCTLFVSALGTWFGTESSSCLKIIDELLEKGVLLEEDCHKLKFAVAVCCEIRLRFYLQQDGQSDHMFRTNFKLQKPEMINLADAVGKSSLIDALATIAMLQQSLLNFVVRGRLAKIFLILPEIPPLRPLICSSLRLHTTAIELCRKMSRNQLNMAFSYRKLLFMCYIDALMGCVRYAEAARVINLNLKNIKNAKMLDLLMFCYDNLRFCFFAIEDGKRSIKFCRKTNFLVYFQLCLGLLPDDAWRDCYKCLGKFTKAMKLTDKKLHFELQENTSGSLDLQQDMYDKGYCLLQLQRFEEAEYWFRKLIDLRRMCVPRRTHDLHLCEYELKLSRCLFYRGKYDEALKLLELNEEPVLCQSWNGKEWNGTFLFMKACYLFALQKYIEAYGCYKNSFNLLSAVGFNKKLLIESLRGLASCSEKLQKYHETLSWNEKLLRALESSRKNQKIIAEIKLRIFQLHVTISIDDDQPSPLVYDRTITKAAKESHDCKLKCLYFFEMAKGSLLQQDSSTAI